MKAKLFNMVVGIKLNKANLFESTFKTIHFRLMLWSDEIKMNSIEVDGKT